MNVSAKQNPPYTPSFSIGLFALLCLAFGLALSVLGFVSLPTGLTAIFSSWVFAHFIWVLQQHIFRSHRVGAFVYLGDAHWEVFIDGAWVPALLAPDGFLSAWLIILNFQIISSGRCYSVVLLRDSLSPEQRSQLCWDIRQSE